MIEQSQKKIHMKIKLNILINDSRLMSAFTNTVRPVKLLNETQNVWASDIFDWKI
jgi:hypothetical protein